MSTLQYEKDLMTLIYFIEKQLTIIKTGYAINIFNFSAHVTLSRFHFLQQLHLFLPSLF